MPKVSAYELDHIEDESTFEKVRRKKKITKETKYPDKKKEKKSRRTNKDILLEDS